MRVSQATTRPLLRVYDAARLTSRQAELLRLSAQGLSAREIARHLGISVRTVEGHFSGMRQRTGTRSHSELIAYAASAGLLQPSNVLETAHTAEAEALRQQLAETEDRARQDLAKAKAESEGIRHELVDQLREDFEEAEQLRQRLQQTEIRAAKAAWKAAQFGRCLHYAEAQADRAGAKAERLRQQLQEARELLGLLAQEGAGRADIEATQAAEEADQLREQLAEAEGRIHALEAAAAWRPVPPVGAPADAHFMGGSCHRTCVLFSYLSCLFK